MSKTVPVFNYERESINLIWPEGNGSIEGVLCYGDFVAALKKPLPPDLDLAHMALGVAGEAGELVDCIKKHIIYGQPLNRPNLVEEMGDMMFFLQGIMILFGITLDEITDANFNKLKVRYKEMTYSDREAEERADKKMGV